MRKSLLFARSNLRKSKGQTVAIAALVLIAAIMLNLWLMLAMDYKKNFDGWHSKLNDGHVTYVMQDGGGVEADIKSAFDGDKRTKDYEMTSARAMVTNLPYNTDVDNSTCVFIKKDEAISRRIGKVEITSDNRKEGIYLPTYYDTQAVKVGKPVTLVVGGKNVEYTLCGFFVSAMCGSGNCMVVEVIMTDSAYADFAAKDCAPQAYFCSVQLKSAGAGESYLAHLDDTVGRAHPDMFAVGNFYEEVVSTRYITQGVISAIVSVMAFLVLLIALIVLTSNIINYIQEKMKNLGAMKALGYTGWQIIGAMVMQFLIITLGVALVGIALSYAIFPLLNDMMIAQTALPYTIRFLPLPAFLSILIPVAAVGLVVFLSSLKIVKIEPIVALRQGNAGGKAKRNAVPLGKGGVPVNIMLGIKTAFSGIKQNVTVFFTMIVLSLIVVFSGVATKNIIADNTQFMNMMAGEQTDCAVTVDKDINGQFYVDMGNDARVKKIYLYHSETMRCGDSSIIMQISDDFSKVNNDIMCEGRYPKTGDEAAIGIKLAKDKGIKLGQSISLTKNGVTVSFKVVGFTQITSNLGRDGVITTEAYGQFGELQNYTYYIDLNGGVDADAFIESVKADYASVLFAANVRSLLDSGIGGYVSLMSVLVIAIVIISMLIVTFVLYLLVRTLLTNKKRDYGVLKALGYTTGQLILQTAVSFLPAMIVSTVIGLTVGCLIMNPLLSVFLAGVGIVKCNFVVPVGMIAGLGAGLIAVSFGIACLLSLKIKKITPHELLIGE